MAFDRNHYEHIRPAFGGGRHQAVEIMLNDPSIRNGLKDMGLDVTPSLKADLIHEN